MSVVALTTQDITRSGSGLSASYTSCVAGNSYTFPNDGRTVAHMKNTGGSPSSVLFNTPYTEDSNTTANLSATIPATTGEKYIGPFPKKYYNDGSDLVTFTTSQTISVAVLRLP